MKRRLSLVIAVLAVISFAFTTPAFAKKEGNPAGWLKGEKKGWEGKDVPPGLDKKNAEKAEKEARKAEKEAKKKAEKAKREAEKEARKAEKEAKEKAEEAKKALENKAS